MRAIAKKRRASPWCEMDFTVRLHLVLRISTSKAVVPRRRPHALLTRSNVRLFCGRAVGRESGALGRRRSNQP